MIFFLCSSHHISHNYHVIFHTMLNSIVGKVVCYHVKQESCMDDRFFMQRLVKFSFIKMYMYIFTVYPQPQARYLHSAVTTDDYMLVFGGRSHYNTSNSLIAYTYSCNQWLRLLTAGQ